MARLRQSIVFIPEVPNHKTTSLRPLQQFSNYPKGPKIGKNSRSPSGIEIFNWDWKFQASHPANPYFFCGEFWRSGLKISIEIDFFQIFRALRVFVLCVMLFGAMVPLASLQLSFSEGSEGLAWMVLMIVQEQEHAIALFKKLSSPRPSVKSHFRHLSAGFDLLFFSLPWEFIKFTFLIRKHLRV